MALASTAVQERRRSNRAESPPRLAIDLLRSDRRLTVDPVNISEAGLCVRLAERLEVRSLINLQLTPSRTAANRVAKPVRCEGRVAWVIQRLDLRDTPPFLFDVGIEFAQPPAILRRLMTGRRAARRAQPARTVEFESAAIRGRQFVPKVERTPGHAQPWHLVISVDGVPCFSERFGSAASARAGWQAFRRRQARR